MLTHYADREDVLTACDFLQGENIEQPGDNMVRACCGLPERNMIKVFAGNKCSLSRNGTFCRHETTCSMRDVVQRSVLKAFVLLGRNTC